MKKWIGLLIVLSVFIFSIKPSYARFVDTKDKTLNSVKLSSPKDDIAISVPSVPVSFESTSNKISLPVSIENNSTYTFKQLDVNVASVQIGSSNVYNWKDYYNITNLPTLSNDNLLFPSKKENISVDKYKKQFSVTITVNNKIPSDTFKFTLSLKFTSIGGAVITKNVDFSIVPKSITSANLNLTGQQNIDFSKSTSEWQGTSQNGIGEATPWTLTNNTGIELTGLNISVIRAKAYSSTENANETDISNSWQDYFKVIFGKNAIEDGTYVKTVSATPGSKNEFYISAKQLKDASAYRKFVLTIAVTCGNDPNLSITKDVNITPRSSGIYNGLPEDLGDLGIAGYFHIFAPNYVFYNGDFDSYGNIATGTLNYNGWLNSGQLINYVSNYLSLNGLIINSSKFVVGNKIAGITNVFGNLQLTREGTNQYLDFTKELIAANTLSHTISNYPNKLIPAKNRYGSYVLDTSTIPDNINICVYNINYDYNNTPKISVNNLKKKFIIINLNVDNYEDIALPTTSISSEDRPYVLWNINRSDDRKISAKRNGFDSNYGTILMPNGSLTLNTAGTFYGNFIGQEFISNGSTQKVETKKFSLNTNIVR